MRIRRLLPLSLAAAVFASAAPASAGGSWLEPDRRVYVPGDVATLRGSFSPNGALQGRVSDGPFVAYLLAEGRWIEPGRVPAGAIPVGELRIVRTDDRHPTFAVVTFEVPALPTGWYHVGYCNDPCTIDGIGDLINGGGRFVVAPTLADGRAIVRIERLSVRLQNVRHHVVARTRDERKRLERALNERSEQLTAALADLAALRAQSDAGTGGPVRAPRSQGGASVTWWIVFIAAVLGLGAGAAIGRRRGEPALVVPDTVPDDLVEREPLAPHESRDHRPRPVETGGLA